MENSSSSPAETDCGPSGSRVSAGTPRRPTIILALRDPLRAAELAARLQDAWPELGAIDVHHDGVAALEAINLLRPEAAFLDVALPGISGMDVADAIDGSCGVVFVADDARHAVQAFALGAVDYLLQPVEASRLSKTVCRLAATLARGSAAPEVQRPLRWVIAATGESVRFIPVDEIRYFQALNKHTAVVAGCGHATIGMPIRRLRELLDPDAFWQIHRSTIVNLRFVLAAHPQGNGQLLLSLSGCEQSLQVSRKFAARFRRM